MNLEKIGFLTIVIYSLISSSPHHILDSGFIKTFGIKGGATCGLSVQQTRDSGFIIAGYSIDLDRDTNIYLVRTDSNGDTVWTKTFGAYLTEDKSYSIQQTSDDGFILCGSTCSKNSGYSFFNMDIYLMRLNINGDTLWTKKFGGEKDDAGYAVIQTADNGFIVAGSTSSFNGGKQSAYMVRTNSNGDTCWTKTYDFKNLYEIRSIRQTTEGGYIFVGNAAKAEVTPKNMKNSYGYLVKTSSVGDTNWTEYLYHYSIDVQQTRDSGFIVVGSAHPGDAEEFFIYKTTDSGSYLWQHYIGGPCAENGYSIQQTREGRYIAVGSTESFGAGKKDVYLIRLNVRGDTLWSKAYGGVNNDCGYSVQQTFDGGFIISGYTETSNDGKTALLLIRTTGDGITGIKKKLPKKDLSSSPSHFSLTSEFTGNSLIIRYASPDLEEFSMVVCDLHGRIRRVLHSGVSRDGFHEAVWNTRDNDGRAVPAGTYIVQIHNSDLMKMEKISLVR